MFWVVLRIDGGQMLGDEREICLSRSFRNSGFEVAHEKPKTIESERRRSIGEAGFFRNPDIGIAPGKTRRHDADEYPRRPVQHEGFVQNARIGVKAVDPSLIAQNEDRRSTGLVVRWLHHPS